MRGRTSSLRLVVFTLAATLACVVATPAPVAAQPASVQVTAADASGWPSIELTVSVIDGAGVPHSGLAASDFSVESGRQEIPVSSLTTTSDPSAGLALVLTFDASGSMQGEPLARAVEAGNALIDRLGPGDQAAVLSFSDSPVVLQGFTADKDLLRAVVNGLSASGDTALYAAALASSEVAASAQLARRAVVFLSDGVDFGVQQTVTREQTIAAAAASGAFWITIGLGGVIDSEYLAELAAAGRGPFLPAPAPSDLLAAYQSAADLLRQQYVLTLDASALYPQAATLPVAVTVHGAGDARATAELNIPPQFVATAAQEPTAAPATPVASGPAAPAGSTAGAEGGSSFPVAAVAGAGALALAGALGLIVLRRRRPAVPAADFEPRRFGRTSEPAAFPGIERVAVVLESSAWLELPEGQRFSLGDEPVTIGFTTDCLVYLQNGVERTDRARVWRREGRYMLHNLSRLGSVSIGGRPVSWAVLEDGDEITVGGRSVIFRDAASPPDSSSDREI